MKIPVTRSQGRGSSKICDLARSGSKSLRQETLFKARNLVSISEGRPGRPSPAPAVTVLCIACGIESDVHRPCKGTSAHSAGIIPVSYQRGQGRARASIANRLLFDGQVAQRQPASLDAPAKMPDPKIPTSAHASAANPPDNPGAPVPYRNPQSGSPMTCIPQGVALRACIGSTGHSPK